VHTKPRAGLKLVSGSPCKHRRVSGLPLSLIYSLCLAWLARYLQKPLFVTVERKKGILSGCQPRFVMKSVATFFTGIKNQFEKKLHRYFPVNGGLENHSFLFEA
jgi:hypothetical protein